LWALLVDALWGGGGGGCGWESGLVETSGGFGKHDLENRGEMEVARRLEGSFEGPFEGLLIGFANPLGCQNTL